MELDTEFPPRVSPLVTNDILFTGYIPYDGKIKSGIILALDKQTGSKLWEFNVDAPIAPSKRYTFCAYRQVSL